MTSFEFKYYVCTHDNATWNTEDEAGNIIPRVFDTKLDAALAVAQHITDIVEAVKEGNMSLDMLDEVFDECRICECSYDGDYFRVFQMDEYGNTNDYFVGTLDEFREQL